MDPRPKPALTGTQITELETGLATSPLEGGVPKPSLVHLGEVPLHPIQPFVKSTSPQTVEETQFLNSNLKHVDILEFALSYWTGYSLAGYGNKAFSNSGHNSVIHMMQEYSQFIDDFGTYANYGNEGLNSFIKKIQKNMKPGDSMPEETLKKQSRIDLREFENGMDVYFRQCGSCKQKGHRFDSRYEKIPSSTVDRIELFFSFLPAHFPAPTVNLSFELSLLPFPCVSTPPSACFFVSLFGLF